MEWFKKYWGHLAVAGAALAALVAAVTSSDVDNQACMQNPDCKAAYERGEAIHPTTSPTAVTPAE